jgi:hypothetical protein
VDLGAAVVAHEQALELVQPGEGALDDPADTTEPGAVVGPAAPDLGRDPTAAQLAPVRGVVVAAIGGKTPRPPTGRPTLRTGGTRRGEGSAG